MQSEAIDEVQDFMLETPKYRGWENNFIPCLSYHPVESKIDMARISCAVSIRMVTQHTAFL
jgi:hypothetical protein